jgi:hypothetical protein
MQHIRRVDEKYQTVIMAQVENEVGLFYDPRDYSEEAVKAYQQGVPADLMQYLYEFELGNTVFSQASRM